MSRINKTALERVLAIVLVVLMLVAIVPLPNKLAHAASGYADVTSLSGGEVKNSGSEKVEVTISEATLEWAPADESIERYQDGWWVGFKVEAPEDAAENAVYNYKTNPANADYVYGEEGKLFSGNTDGTFWMPLTPETLESFRVEKKRDLVLDYFFDWDADGNFEQEVVFTVVPSGKIVLMQDGAQQYPVKYATVTPLTEGAVVNEENPADITVSVESAELVWAPADESIERYQDGWWVGFKVEAPAGSSENALYNYKTNPANADYVYGEEGKLFSENTDGTFWMPITDKTLESFKIEKQRNLVLEYSFDWDADGEYEQVVTFSVTPSDSIILKKGDDVVYPHSYATVEALNEGAVVNDNASAKVEVLVEEVVLEWAPADESIERYQDGWWVGFKVTAPEGASEKAVYNYKSNPANADYVYGEEGKLFSGNTDGTFWMPVTPETLEDFRLNKDRDLVLDYFFDWNANGAFDQEVIFRVKPSATIILNKDGSQVYPEFYGEVTALTEGATVEGNNSAVVNVIVEEAVLEWAPADESIERYQDGWWVGFKVEAPAGYSKDANYNYKTRKGEEYPYVYEANKLFSSNEDGTFWMPISPETLESFRVEKKRDLVLDYFFDWDADGNFDQEVVFTVKPTDSLTLKNGEDTVYPSACYATVEALTGGTVNNEDPAKVEVTVEEAVLEWAPADESIGRYQDGWWVGIKVTAPEGASENAVYNYKSNPTKETYVYDENRAYSDDDGTFWMPLSPETLEDFRLNKQRNLVLDYFFDWNGNGAFEQEVLFTVVPSAKIVLMQDDVQVYPEVYGTVEALTGGEVNNNATEKVEVTVEEAVLEWFPADEGIGRYQDGWWVGIKVNAPMGYDLNAVYNYKSNPTKETYVYDENQPYVADDGTFWMPLSPETLEDFRLNKQRNLALDYFFDWNADGEFEQEVLFSVVPGRNIVLMQDGVQAYPEIYGTVTPLTEGTVTVNNDDPAKIEVKYEEAVLEWFPKDDSIGRYQDGWWVGIKVNAPKGYDLNAVYNYKSNPTKETYVYEENQAYSADDGTFWMPLSSDLLDKFKNSKMRDLALLYFFDWDANGEFEQEILFSVKPNDGIVLMQGETQVYPAYASVSCFSDATITNDKTEKVEVLVESTVLNWFPADETIGRYQDGWWIGIKVDAPEGAAENATYNYKSNPTKETYVYEENQPYSSDDGTFWMPINPELLEKFRLEKNRDLTLDYFFDWNGNGIFDQEVVFSVRPSGSIVLMQDGIQVYPEYYGTVISINDNDAVIAETNGTEKVEVYVENAELVWAPADDSIGRYQDGWWIGIEVTAPMAFSKEATYNYKSNPANDTFVLTENALFDDNDDSINKNTFWMPINPELLEKFRLEKGRNLALDYFFDWNADGEFDQEIVFNVVPGRNIVLMQDDVQVYPELYATVGNYTNAEIENNTTAEVTVTAKDTTIEWLAGDENVGRADGWWIGINLTAPKGFADTAKIKLTNGETVKEYNFADIKDDINFVQLWNSITPDSLEAEVAPEFVYECDWDGDGAYEQIVNFIPDTSSLILMQWEELVEGEELVHVQKYPRYAVTFVTENGTATADPAALIERTETAGGTTDITFVSDPGYTIGNDSISVEPASAEIIDLVKVEEGKYTAKLVNITSDVTVTVNFKEIALATSDATDALIIDCVPLRTKAAELTKYEVNKDGSIVIEGEAELSVIKGSTVAEGRGSVTFSIKADESEEEQTLDVFEIALLNADGTVIAETNDSERSITISDSTYIAGIKLYYQDANDTVAEWHYIDRAAMDIVFDDALASIEVFASRERPFEYDGTSYYNSDVTFDIKVIDPDDYSGIDSVTYTINGDVLEDEGYKYTEGRAIKDCIVDYFTVDSETYNSSGVSVVVTVIDRAGNSYSEEKIININSTAPVLEAKYVNDDQEPNAVPGYYNERTIEFTVTDREDTFVPERLILNITAINANGEEKTYEADITEWTDNVARYTFVEDAKYTISATYANRADLSADVIFTEYSDFNYSFWIDDNDPTNLDIKLEAKGVEDKSVKVTDDVVFDTYYDQSVIVKAYYDCGVSGLQTIQYQKVVSTEDYNKEGAWTTYDEKGIKINPTEKFIVYFKVVDNAGNISYFNSTGIVVDDKNPLGEKHAPELDIIPLNPTASGIYTGDVTVDVKVLDPKYIGVKADPAGYYSGLKNITYKIYTTDTDAVETGVLFDLETAKTTGAIFDNDGLANTWAGKISIDSAKFNSNNVFVEITATDNADNTETTTTEAGDIKIDITKPVIDITYDNNNGDTSYTESVYYKENRTATIVITERNFNASKVDVTITNTDGVIPAISAFTTAAAGGNGDATTYTATISYTADGDYTFAIAYADEAGNVASAINHHSQASEKFTIDKTTPVITTSYDNNTYENTGYFKEARVLTIVVNEHNFDESRFTTTTTGQGMTQWTHNGDVHTAKISFTADNRYTFNCTYKDKAGNEAATRADESFVIDLTMPEVRMEDAIKGSAAEEAVAYNGEVNFILYYGDTNIDRDRVEVILTDSMGNNVSNEILTAPEINGNEFIRRIVDTVEQKAIPDGIYTLTVKVYDLAGNSTETAPKVISVNRDSSSYIIDEVLQGYINNVYNKTIDKDVIISEVNCCEITSVIITVSCNGTSRTLEEGKDYKIDKSRTSSQWYQNDYIIDPSVFAEDGKYAIIIESKDAADNSISNLSALETKGVEFSVDDIAPTLILMGLEKPQYDEETHPFQVMYEDNLNLDRIEVTVTIDGEATTTVYSIDELGFNVVAGEISHILDEADKYQLISIIAYDKAGNASELIEDRVTVSTSDWVRYINSPLYVGLTIGGIVLVAAGITVPVVISKKKKAAKK